MFLGIGIPYNHELISLTELEKIGQKIVSLDTEVQVCVLDYNPDFRRMDLPSPSYTEMMEVHKTLRGTGLKTVICQIRGKHICPQGTLLA